MTYDFKCSDCGECYDEWVSKYDETGMYADVTCPKCGSSKKVKLMSACGFNFTNPEGTDRWNSEDKGHDYRFKSKQPKLREERELAMKTSHMGDKPYNNIDDISSGKYFGEVR